MQFLLFIIILLILIFIIENIVSTSIIIGTLFISFVLFVAFSEYIFDFFNTIKKYFLHLIPPHWKPLSKDEMIKRYNRKRKNKKNNSYQKYLSDQKFTKKYPAHLLPFSTTNVEEDKYIKKGRYIQRGWCDFCNLWCMFIIDITDSERVDEYSPYSIYPEHSKKYLGTETSITYNCKCSLCDSKVKGFKIKHRHAPGKNITLVGDMWDSTIHDTSRKQQEGLSFFRQQKNHRNYMTKRDNMIEQRLVRSKGLRRFNQRLMAFNMNQINSIEMACNDDGFIASDYLTVFMTHTPELEDKNKTKYPKPGDLVRSRLHRLIDEVDTLTKLRNKSIINEEEFEKKKDEIILNSMELRYRPLNVILSMGKRELRKSLEVKK